MVWSNPTSYSNETIILYWTINYFVPAFNSELGNLQNHGPMARNGGPPLLNTSTPFNTKSTSALRLGLIAPDAATFRRTGTILNSLHS